MIYATHVRPRESKPPSHLRSVADVDTVEHLLNRPSHLRGVEIDTTAARCLGLVRYRVVAGVEGYRSDSSAQLFQLAVRVKALSSSWGQRVTRVRIGSHCHAR